MRDNTDLIYMALNQKSKTKRNNAYINIKSAEYIINNIDKININEKTRRAYTEIIKDDSRTYEDKIIYIVLYNQLARPNIKP